MLEQDGPYLRERLRDGGTLGVFWSAFGSPALVEVAVEARPDAMVIDAQHGLWDRQAIEHAVGTVGAKTPVLIRIADARPGSIGEALDSGAEGIIVPLIETPEQASAAVAAARFPPHGHRSGGGVRPLKSDFMKYYNAANERTVVGIMIETVLGMDNAGAIAATPGLDFILIGTGDLGLSLGGIPTSHPDHQQACRSIKDACGKAGVPCAIFTANAGDAAKRTAEGYALVVAANDLEVVASGFAASMNRFGEARQAGNRAEKTSGKAENKR